MSDDAFLLCSGCYTPCALAEGHVVPRWRPDVGSVITAYRCPTCWLASLAELRAALSTEPEAQTGFCDFLARRGYAKDAEALRAAPDDERLMRLLVLVDALETDRLRFDP